MATDDDAPEPIEPDWVDMPRPVKTIGRPFPKGQSGNPSGKTKIAADVIRKMKERTDDAAEALFALLEHPDWEARKFAIETILRWGLGKPPTTPTTTAQQLPRSPEARLKALEDLLVRFAMDGDPTALKLSLAALAPDRYGRASGNDDGDDKPPPTRVNFVAQGAARPGHGLADSDE